MEFGVVRDPDYGVVLKYPRGWVFTGFGEKGVWAVRDPNNEVGIVVVILDDLLGSLDLGKIAQFSVLKLFGQYFADVEVLERPSGESTRFRVRVRGSDSSYILLGFSRVFDHFLGDYSARDTILYCVVFDEGYLGTEAEPYIARLIANLPLLVKKELSLFGKNVPFKRFEYVSSPMLGGLRWSVEVPANYGLRPDIYGFEVFTDRFYVSIRAHHLFIDFKDFVESRLLWFVQNYLELDKYVVIREVVEDDKAFYHLSDPEDLWRIFGYWDLQNYYNLAKEEMFSIVLEKVAIYPSRIELDFLPIISRIFTSFTTGPYWLYEDIGLLELSLNSSSNSSQIPQITPRKVEVRKTPSQSRKERTRNYERWRQKLKDDMRRLYDWEEKLWESTFSAIKTSDIITGMYTLEDKRRKTKLVSTSNIATPSTHRFWKPKGDVLWHSNVTVATNKFTRPPLRHEWEELKWHWTEEIKRLRQEIDKKKREIDELL